MEFIQNLLTYEFLQKALAIGAISQNSRIKSDASIGIVFSAAFAIGIILITAAQSATDLTQILFGNVLHVRSSDMWLTLIIGCIVLLVVFIFYKELLISSFDETMSAVYGLKTRFIHYGIMVLLTLVTVASLQTVGVILVVSMLITPASTAYLLSNKLSTMIVLSSIFGALSSLIGMYFSYIYNLPSGPVIALATTDADILFYNGLNLEGGKNGWFFKMIESVKQKEENIYSLTERVEPMYLSSDDGKDEEINPHSFIAPSVGIKMAEDMRDAFMEKDPDRGSDYEERANHYI